MRPLVVLAALVAAMGPSLTAATARTEITFWLGDSMKIPRPLSITAGSVTSTDALLFDEEQMWRPRSTEVCAGRYSSASCT